MTSPVSWTPRTQCPTPSSPCPPSETSQGQRVGTSPFSVCWGKFQSNMRQCTTNPFKKKKKKILSIRVISIYWIWRQHENAVFWGQCCAQSPFLLSLALIYCPGYRIHFPAAVRIHNTSSDPQSSLPWCSSCSPGLPGLHEYHASCKWATTVITCRQRQLTSINWPACSALYQAHSCSTSGEVKLLSCLISCDLGYKGSSL